MEKHDPLCFYLDSICVNRMLDYAGFGRTLYKSQVAAAGTVVRMHFSRFLLRS